MILHIQAIGETPNSTLSVLTIEGKFICFVLEDGYRDKKVPGLTRIPPGRYPLLRRRVGGFYNRYREKYKHAFSMHIDQVPNFTEILIHMGNTVEDTRGCLLVGFKPSYLLSKDVFALYNSEPAYKTLYFHVSKAFSEGKEVLVIIDREIPPYAV